MFLEALPIHNDKYGHLLFLLLTFQFLNLIPMKNSLTLTEMCLNNCVYNQIDDVFVIQFEKEIIESVVEHKLNSKQNNQKAL